MALSFIDFSVLAGIAIFMVLTIVMGLGRALKPKSGKQLFKSIGVTSIKAEDLKDDKIYDRVKELSMLQMMMGSGSSGTTKGGMGDMFSQMMLMKMIGGGKDMFGGMFGAKTEEKKQPAFTRSET